MTTRICKRGHTVESGKKCQECKRERELRYSRRTENIIKAKACRMKRISERDLAAIKAAAKAAADKANALALSRMRQPPPAPAPVYVDTGMGYSVRRYYP